MTDTPEAEARSLGLRVIRKYGTAARLRAAGLELRRSRWENWTFFGPVWAVLVCEGAELSTTRQDRLLRRAIYDEDFQRALDALARLTDEGVVVKVLEEW